MVIMIVSFVSVLAFCICCRFLIKTILKPVPQIISGTYKRSALRVKKVYAVFAWSVMTGSFLFTLVVSFVQVYTTL
jgi:hypothetical protein